MEQLDIQGKLDLMPQNYLLKFLSFSRDRISSNRILKGEKPFYLLELGNVAISSIKSGFNIRQQFVKNEIVSLLDEADLDYLAGESVEELFVKYTEYLSLLSRYSQKHNQTLFLGFSFMGAYDFYPKLFEIIIEIKAQNPNLIIVAGGADFNGLPDKEFLEIVFTNGIDIVNIGGSKNFMDFINSLSLEDVFYRGMDGKLSFQSSKTLPDNLLFSVDDVNFKSSPKDAIRGYYDNTKRCFYFSMSNSSCLNSCSYCANSIHEESQKINNNTYNSAISDFNEQISAIDDNDIGVELQMPNPTQYIDDFVIFMKSINLSKVSGIAFYADFMGLGNPKTYKKFTDLIDWLLESYPKLSINTNFAVDALHY